MRLVLPILAAALIAGQADAQSLRAKQAQAQADSEIAVLQKDMAASCGKEIKAGYDWATFPDEIFKQRKNPFLRCREGVDALKQLCESDDGVTRDVIASKVDAYVCRYGEKKAMSYKDGEVGYTTDMRSAINFRYIRDWLLDNL